MDIINLLEVIWPLVVLQVLFQVYALYDLFKTKSGKTRNLSAVVWAIIIIIGEIVGPAIYFLVGRGEE
jgi:hypothetical protein